MLKNICKIFPIDLTTFLKYDTNINEGIMDYAINNKNVLVNASDADYGIYFCSECLKPCGLRKPKDKISHFYHFRIDPNCSLCFSSEYISTDYLNLEILNKCNDAFEILIKNTTEANWFEALFCLIEGNL